MKNNIYVGTWAWGQGQFAGGDTVFGHHLDTPQLSNVFDAALAKGLNAFDTAYAYGLGASEEILGKLISTTDRSNLLISDKFTPQLANLQVENPLMEMLAGSLKRLGTDYLDIYWIHNSADIEKWTPQLALAVKSGKVKKIGVSNHSLAELIRVREILAKDGLDIGAVQNHFSLLYQHSLTEGLLDYCKANGIEFFAYMVLEQGALSGKYTSEKPFPAGSQRASRYNNILPKLTELLVAMEKLARKYQVSSAQIAEAWALFRGTTPIIGVTNSQQVEELSQVTNLKLTANEAYYLENLALEAAVDTSGGWEGQA